MTGSSAYVPHRWGPATKALAAMVAAVVTGVLSLGAGGMAGAAGGSTGSGQPGTPGQQSARCTGVVHQLSGMRHRQAELSAKVARLEAASVGAAKAGRAHRAATDRRDLVRWQRIEAHKISARFLRREARLAALATAHCSADTTAPTTVPTGSTA